MGLIIAKFRKKKSSVDMLENVDKQIVAIENFLRNTEEQRKRIVGKFVFGSVGFFTCSAILFYFYFKPQTYKEQFLYIVPFLCVPVIIFCMKHLISMYYNRKLTKNTKKLTELRSEKKQLLEKIMDTETYKVARSILERYAPDHVRKVNISQELSPIAPKLHQIASITPNPGLRNRLAPANRQLGQKLTPIGTPYVSQSPQIVMPPVNRTFFDKMVDYLIGEGPNNRYALICKQCRSHNGMTLMHEYEYTSYKCFHCATFNPAVKKRPIAPKLEFEATNIIEPTSDTSDSEKISGSESETEQSPRIEVVLNRAEMENGETHVSSDNEPNDFDKLSDFDAEGVNDKNNDETGVASQQDGEKVEEHVARAQHDDED